MPRTVAEIGNTVFDQLTAEEKEHLAAAMLRAAASEDDGRDLFYKNLSNAGVAVPISESDDVTEADMRAMCRVLERARRNEAEVDEIDWDCLLTDAFGRGNEKRFLALYAAAARPASVGAVVFEQLTAEEKAHLAAAMRAASESGWGDGTDEFYGSLGDAGVVVSVRRGEPITDGDMIKMCGILEDARRSPRTTDTDWRFLLGKAFGRTSADRVVALYAAADG